MLLHRLRTRRELDGLEERAKLSGASKLYIENIIDEFCDDYVMPCVKAGAVMRINIFYGTSMARPVIAKRLVEIARKEARQLFVTVQQEKETTRSALSSESKRSHRI